MHQNIYFGEKIYILLFILRHSFFLLKTKRKNVAQERKTHGMFSMPCGHKIKWLFAGKPALLRSLPCFAHARELYISFHPSITERINNVGETTTRRVLSERSELTRLQSNRTID